MNILVTKILARLVYPLSFSLLLGIIAGLLLLWGRERLGGTCLAISIGWLWLWSTPVFSDAVRASLEQTYPPVPVEELPQADAILVLGGGVLPAVPPMRPDPDLNSGADRVWYAARLYKAGKAPTVVISGGRLPWIQKGEPEAYAILEFLKDLGVPQAAVMLEAASANTYQNARYSAPLLEANGIESVLLVTSALHMPRAMEAFRAVDIQALPAPTDFEVVPARNNILRWLPGAAALEGSTRAFKEYLGRWMYRMRYRLGS